VKIQVVFWAVTPCCVVIGYQHFGGPCCPPWGFTTQKTSTRVLVHFVSQGPCNWSISLIFFCIFLISNPNIYTAPVSLTDSLKSSTLVRSTPRRSLTFRLSDWNCVFHVFPLRATCPSHIILVDSITLITVGERWKNKSDLQRSRHTEAEEQCLVSWYALVLLINI
jgi:hypothetical protein